MSQKKVYTAWTAFLATLTLEQATMLKRCIRSIEKMLFEEPKN